MKRGGKKVYLGIFATAEEAALCVARSPEGPAVAQKAAVHSLLSLIEKPYRKAKVVGPAQAQRASATRLPLTSEDAQQEAQAEGLALRVAESKTGYAGVGHQPSKPSPYQAKVSLHHARRNRGHSAPQP